jgi:hypothetical protein
MVVWTSDVLFNVLDYYRTPKTQKFTENTKDALLDIIINQSVGEHSTTYIEATVNKIFTSDDYQQLYLSPAIVLKRFRQKRLNCRFVVFLPRKSLTS